MATRTIGKEPRTATPLKQEPMVIKSGLITTASQKYLGMRDSASNQYSCPKREPISLEILKANFYLLVRQNGDQVIRRMRILRSRCAVRDWRTHAYRRQKKSWSTGSTTIFTGAGVSIVYVDVRL